MRALLDQLYLFHNATFIPMTVLNKGGEPELFIGTELLPHSFLTQLWKNTQEKKVSQAYHLVQEDKFIYGILPLPQQEMSLLLGPVLSLPYDKSDYEHFRRAYGFSLKKQAALVRYFDLVPLFSYEQTYFLSELLYSYLFQVQVNPDFNLRRQELTDTSSKQEFELEHALNSFKSKEIERFHNTYYFEAQLLSYVRQGNLTAINNLLAKPTYISAGIMSHSPLRQEQNTLITTLTLVTRHSIQGGLDIEKAYLLCDSYIQKSEQSKTVQQVHDMLTQAVLDFTTKVQQSQLPDTLSPIVSKSIHFIRQQTNHAITVAQVAEEVNRSPAYLSRLFKKETGIDPSRYIMKAKIDEAKHLLSYTDLTITEISSALCFSSQSYFQNVFKKFEQVTPRAYRLASKI